MRILLTGHKGYIGAVAGPILRSAGHEVVGLDMDLFAGCEFGELASDIPEFRKDIRDVKRADLEGFERVAVCPGPWVRYWWSAAPVRVTLQTVVYIEGIHAGLARVQHPQQPVRPDPQRTRPHQRAAGADKGNSVTWHGALCHLTVSGVLIVHHPFAPG